MECQCSDLLTLLLKASDRAARLAVAFRQSQSLQGAVEEKVSVVKNQQTLRDFKTVADVMVQAMVRHEIAAEFPSVAQHVLGEESGWFTAPDGARVELAVCPTEQETAALLATAMGGATDVAGRMAAVVHGPPPDVSPIAADQASQLDRLSLPVDDLGVWIDPIDGTSEFVRGAAGDVSGDVTQRGLPAVTVLVGVFQRSSGCPLMGVVTQPFARRDGGSWTSAQYWGVCAGDVRISNIAPRRPTRPAVVTSASERSDVIGALRAAGLQPLSAAGAGNKLLQVALGSAVGYVLSLSTTFLWDTCGPEALVRAVGGTVAFADGRVIRYNSVGQNGSRNQGCLVATVDAQVRQRILQALRRCENI